MSVIYLHVTSSWWVPGWTFEPVQTVGLLFLAVLYIRGCLRARRGGTVVGWTRPAVFTLGFGLLAVALLSPMHHGAEELVSVHMAQHAVLIVAPLLLIAGRAGTRILQALPRELRGAVARRTNGLGKLTSRTVALLVFVATAVFWHIPAIFEPATRVPALHALEHVTLMASATMYWLSIVGLGARRNSRYGASLASILVVMLVGGAIGGLMTFSTVAWYPEYAERTTVLGGDWLTDQQLAGVWMWVPMSVVLMGVGAWLGYQWSAPLLRHGEPVPSEALVTKRTL